MNSHLKGAGLMVSAMLLISSAAGCAKDLDAPTPANPSSITVTKAPRPSAEKSVPTQQVNSTSAEPSPSSVEPSATSESPTPSPTPSPSEKPLLAPGDTGDQVRELQHRLLQLNWYDGKITDNYGPTTQEAVTGFQRKRELPASGSVDQATWTTLVGMTKMPTHDQMHNILRPGPALYKSGSTGDSVRRIQVRLKQLDWYAPLIDGQYAASTVAAVKGFQAKREIPVTGEVDQRTLDILVAMTRTPTPEEMQNLPPKAPAPGRLDSRCMTGRVLCISKDTRRLYWMIDGKVIDSFSVRFGGSKTPTREGQFSVYWKSRNHHSTLYDSPMPFAMFFDGGQAVHYSSDFAARGYAGASKGCVNVRDRAGIEWLFDQVKTGDKVIVFR